MLGEVRLRKLVRVGHQDACDVECDVAVSDDHRSLAGQIESPIGISRVAVVPGDELGGGVTSRQILARDLELAIPGSTHRVDHCVVMVQEFRMRDVGTHLDVEVAAHGLFRDHGAELVGDAFGSGMIRRHAGAHQSVGSGKPIEHVDLDARLAGQFHRRIAGCGAGADDRHFQRSQFGIDLGHRDRLGPIRAHRMLLEVRRVHLQVRRVVLVEFVVREDRLDRAFVHTRTTIDAGVGIDVEHFGGRERSFVRCRVNAIDRTHVNTRGVVAARLRDHIRHDIPLSLKHEARTGSQTITCSNLARESFSDHPISLQQPHRLHGGVTAPFQRRDGRIAVEIHRPTAVAMLSRSERRQFGLDH